MPKPLVRPGAMIAEKWSRRAAAAAGDYSTGVEQTPADWAAATAAAQSSYETGVQEAIGRKAFAKGAAAKGTASWKRITQEKGPLRFGQGVQLAQGEYSAGVQVYLDTIAATDLPPRGPRGAAGNQERSAILNRALRAAKTKRA